MGGEGEIWWKSLGEGVRISCGIGEQWVLAQEKDGEIVQACASLEVWPSGDCECL
jgi:hypothetical protein